MTDWFTQAQLKKPKVFHVPDIRLGIGYDSLKNDTRALAVQDDDIYVPPVETAPEVKAEVLKIESLRELREALEISVSASYSGLFSVSAKVDWSRETEIKEQYLYLMVTCKVISGTKKLNAPYVLTEKAQAKLSQDPINWVDFRTRYGDTFIETITYGGEFYVLYEFQTRSSSEKTQLMAKLEGSYGAFSASAEVKRRVESIQVDTKTSVSYFVRGGTGQLPDITPENILDALLEFPVAVKLDGGAPALLSATYKDFQVVDDFPIVPDIDDSQQAYKTLDILSRRIDAALDVAKGNYRAVIPEGVNAAEELKKRIAAYQHTLSENPLRSGELPGDFQQDYNAQIAPLAAWCPRLNGLQNKNVASLSVADDEHIMAVDSEGATYYWNGEAWVSIGGRALTISAATNGMFSSVNHVNQVWFGNNKAYQGKQFEGVWAHYWNGQAWGNNPPNDYRLRVSITATDSPKLMETYYMVTTTGRLYRYYRAGNIWQEVVKVADNGAEVAKWSAGKDVTGTITSFPFLTAMSVGSEDYDTICVIDEDNFVYKLVMKERTATGTITVLPVKLKHVSVCDKDDIWGIDMNDHVVRWTGNVWVEIPMPIRLSAISVGKGRVVWGITENGTPVEMMGKYWLERDGKHALPFDPAVIKPFEE